MKLEAPTVQETHTENQMVSPPGSQAFIRSLPSACLCLAIGLPRATFSYVLSLAGIWDSKLQILKDQARCRPTLLLWRRASRRCTQQHSVPEKQSQASIGAWSLWWSTVKSCDQVILPSECASALDVQWLLNCAQQAFCPWRGKILSSKYTPGRGAFSPSATQGIPTPHVLCEPYVLISPPLSPSLPDLSV